MYFGSPKWEKQRGKREEKHYITIVISKTEARFIVKIFLKDVQTGSKETMGCMTSEVPAKFKIILFSFIDPKYRIERLYFKTLMVRSRIHLLLNTILGTEYTAVKKSQGVYFLMECGCGRQMINTIIL